ncbi:TrmH family RNA methyltransferase [Virgisporangium ochraceum]|uniref:TrmH family RNA methyltransferase n=1 Tax=Virgisporangium ochraceum TaxID=65505 RepID=UPI001942EB0B|nr:RNA methyltransferase [Virgisporangium ochraceum]
MAEIITSAANPLVKRVRLLADRRHRRREGAFVVDGVQPVWRAVEAGAAVETLIVAPDLLAGSPAMRMVEEQEALGTRVARVSGELFLRLSDREGAPGLAAIVRGRVGGLSALPADGVLVALHRVANPGNLGTVIRTADAAGAAGVVLVGDTTDPFAPAAVKASMGSLFAVNVAHTPTLDAFFTWAADHAVTVVATSGYASVDHWATRYPRPVAVLLGSEGDGLPDEALARADRRVRIPMTGTAESLNLAVAASLMLYELNRP